MSPVHTSAAEIAAAVLPTSVVPSVSAPVVTPASSQPIMPETEPQTEMPAPGDGADINAAYQNIDVDLALHDLIAARKIPYLLVQLWWSSSLLTCKMTQQTSCLMTAF